MSSEESFIKHLKNMGIIKHLSIFLPHKTLDLMYKARIPSEQTQAGVTLNALMEKLK